MTAFIDAAEAPARHTGQIKLHGLEAFEGMRKAGRLAAECLDMLVPHVVPGVLTSTPTASSIRCSPRPKQPEETKGRLT